MGLRPTQGNEKRLPSATALHGSNRSPWKQPPSPLTATLSFVIPSEAEGSAVLLPPSQASLSNHSPL
jgi:hypothetical protein